ncbi:polyhydroxyalkanoic acid system family protein [Flavisphingomonas formosensis]|uniref:polyhydroxyalkanoic acid system family protein n=1 Tax=Flavisphingomonas formosensis TaxID=861534 RepID=UPI0012F85290|nr:polyhydroxyalkanoic acid system family protein [Sphingomonas formosensis]
MSQPITVDIPHSMGRDAARAKIESGLGKFASILPGSAITEHQWQGDALAFTVEALGQRVASRVEVMEDKVHMVLDLPPALALFAGKIRQKLREEGPKLLK